LNSPRGLAHPPKMPYVPSIEFRPNDLASPRIARLTDDILPKSRMSRLRSRAAYIHTYLQEGLP
jgi:hypothetical protein